MVKVHQINPVIRAIAVIGAVMALVTGITFAALSSTATLTNNTISAADSNLLVWDETAQAFETEAPGFTITDLIPGEGSGPNLFYLHNDSDGPVYVSAHVPAEPEVPAGGYGFTGWENLKVTFTSLKTGCAEGPVETNMAELLAGNVELPCNTLAQDAMGNNQPGAEGTEGNYSVEFDIDPASLTPGAEDAGVGSFDLQLIGDLVDPSPPTT